MTIPGVGEVTALTWVLETGEPEHFGSIKQAVSYCGLCSAQHESAGKEMRGPISKKRNKHIQTILVEAAKIAPIMNLLVSRIINLSEILFYLKSGLSRAQFLSTARPDCLKGIV